MPGSYQEYKKTRNTHFDPYFPTCSNGINDLQNELAGSLDDCNWDDLSQLDHSEIAVHSAIAHSNSDSAADLPALIISSSTDSYDAQELDSPHLPERPNRVRFRSRVRITSGLNRHRHNSQKKQQNQSEFDSFSFSPASSVSCSPSSSISVPLRTHTDEQVGRPGWGTLGQRVSLFARGNIERRKLREQRERIGLGASEVERRGYGGVEPPLIPCVGTNEVNEETPLLLSPSSRRRHMDSDSAREDDARQMSREIEIAFGSWPGRLANHHVGVIQGYPVLWTNPLIGLASCSGGGGRSNP